MIRKLLIFTIFLISIFFILPQAAQAATYYVAVEDPNASDSNPGTSQEPWKMLAKAQASVSEGDTVYLRNGNYGSYNETLTASRSDWIMYKAATGHTPVFTQIYVHSSVSGTARNAYLKFDGINIQHPNWEPATGDDGDYHSFDTGAPGFLVYITDANYVQLLNGKYEGYYKWISLGLMFVKSDSILLKHCEITNFNGSGVQIVGCNNFTVDNCYAHNMVNSSCLRVLGGCTGTILTNNQINYETVIPQASDEPYYPHNLETTNPTFFHNGSGISIRSPDVIVRKNIVRGGFPQALMFYSGVGVYHNMIIENNLFYDTGRVALYECGENIVVRNNAFIGYVRVEGTGKYAILQRYSGTSLDVYIAAGYDGSKIGIYNNILINWWGVDPSSAIQEDYDIIWVNGGTNGYKGSKGEHSITAVWKEQISPYTLYGYPNFFEDIGFRGSTPEYDYSRDGIQPFFVNPGFYFDSVGDYKDRGRIFDYHLADGSPAINFGATQVATWEEVLSGQVTEPSQPPDSLGSLGSDGFIRDDGPARDASHHSVGCYEYISGAAILYGDVSGEGEVTAYDAALTAQAAVELITLTAEQAKAADVSGEGEVTAYDAALIAQRAVGLIDKFPVEQ